MHGVRPSVVLAVKTLFGVQSSDVQVILSQIRPIDLKQLFRKRAMETHPDRAQALGRRSEDLAIEFKAVASAYDVLRRHLGTCDRGPTQGNRARPTPPVKPRAAQAPRPAATGQTWVHGLPQRHLRLGQFLYYTGKISWHFLVQALAWQGRQRPCFGRLAQGWGYVGAKDIRSILAHRRLGETIGEAAVRLGLMTPYQRDAVVGMQKRMQRRLGDYFVEAGLFSQEEMDEVASKHRAHNATATAHGQSRRRRAAA